jgi:hypothetical protein
MEKAELKQILKPLIKQCVKEVIFEDGVLSGIISEVIKGTSSQQIVVEAKPSKKQVVEKPNKARQQIAEAKKKLAGAIGKNAYAGIDLFEGTKPLTNAQSGHGDAHSPLANIEPDNPGVDISNIPGVNNWKHLIK